MVTPETPGMFCLLAGGLEIHRRKNAAKHNPVFIARTFYI